MRFLKAIAIVLSLGFFSCDNKTSLQEYYVENQNNQQFLALDVPTSLLTGDNSTFNAEQRVTLESIKKVNLLGYPMTDENRASFEEEKSRLTSILQDGKYHTLMKYGGGTRKAELYYSGKEDAIDELIVFGYDEDKGFGIARVLGEDMEPEALIKLFTSMGKGDMDIEGLQSLIENFK